MCVVCRCCRSQALDHKSRGNELYKARKFDEALEEYGKAIELYDKDVSFLTNRWVVHTISYRADQLRRLCQTQYDGVNSWLICIKKDGRKARVCFYIIACTVLLVHAPLPMLHLPALIGFIAALPDSLVTLWQVETTF